MGVLQGEDAGLEGLVLPQQPLHRRSGLQQLGGGEVGDLVVLLPHLGQMGEGPAAAHQLDAHAGAEFLAGEQLHQPHLAGGGHVGAAAGAGVRPGEGDDAHLSLDGLFAPVLQMGQLLRGGVGDLDRVVLPDVPVGRRLQRPDLVLGELHVEVNGDHVGPHVEAHVVAAVHGVGQAGDDVFPGVVLHQVEAAGPVDLPLHGAPLLQRGGAGVDHMALPLVDLQHLDPAQGAQVIGLAAPLGVEGGLVQNHVPPLPALGAGAHPGGEAGEKRVFLI